MVGFHTLSPGPGRVSQRQELGPLAQCGLHWGRFWVLGWMARAGARALGGWGAADGMPGVGLLRAHSGSRASPLHGPLRGLQVGSKASLHPALPHKAECCPSAFPSVGSGWGQGHLPSG